MSELLKTIESLASARLAAGKAPLAELGVISCASQVDIKHAPFFEPCILLVLSGRKVIFDGDKAVACNAGEALAVPAPASFDLRNEPCPHSGRYVALIIPFEHGALGKLRNLHDLPADCRDQHVRVLHFGRDSALEATVRHYLASAADPQLKRHRLLEILLILCGKDSRLLSFELNRNNWSQRVRTVFATDLTRSWEVADVCRRLATSESTLRRNLNEEGTGFRKLLHELRLSTALQQLLQTSLPVYQVAYDCGYQSVSHFSQNFHKRFGLSPSVLRTRVTGSEQNLAV